MTISVYLREEKGLRHIGYMDRKCPFMDISEVLLALARPPETGFDWIGPMTIHPSHPAIFLEMYRRGVQDILVCKQNDDEDLFDRSDFIPV